jgi:hypothetical protein
MRLHGGRTGSVEISKSGSGEGPGRGNLPGLLNRSAITTFPTVECDSAARRPSENASIFTTVSSVESACSDEEANGGNCGDESKPANDEHGQVIVTTAATMPVKSS